MYLQTPLNKGQDLKQREKKILWEKRDLAEKKKKKTRKKKKLQVILPEERKKRARCYLKEQTENKKTLRKKKNLSKYTKENLKDKVEKIS